jgi:uncharacterized protein (DUF433 family)
MAKDYIEKRDGGFWIVGKRVALDTIVYAYVSGHSPESIREALPVLTLEEVHGALAFYLANLHEVEATMVEDEEELEKLRLTARERNPVLFRKLQEARKTLALQKQK